MKKYTEVIIETAEICDVISTSEDVTTGGVKLPWSTDTSASAYQLLKFTHQGTAFDNSYDL